MAAHLAASQEGLSSVSKFPDLKYWKVQSILLRWKRTACSSAMVIYCMTLEGTAQGFLCL
jgi:hypothetical protein